MQQTIIWTVHLFSNRKREFHEKRIGIAIDLTVKKIQTSHPQFFKDQTTVSSPFLRDFSNVLRAQILAHARKMRAKRLARIWMSLNYTTGFQKWFNASTQKFKQKIKKNMQNNLCFKNFRR